MRLNLGCGELPILGYVNVDLISDIADVRGDIRDLEFENVEGVNMDHVLEHLPFRDVLAALQRIRGWMLNSASIRIEVPDMEAIMASPGPNWIQYIYGSQEHDGEFHRGGFTATYLRDVLAQAGFRDIHTQVFHSQHPARMGMPCLQATAKA